MIISGQKGHTNNWVIFYLSEISKLPIMSMYYFHNEKEPYTKSLRGKRLFRSSGFERW